MSDAANPAWKPIRDVYERVAPELAELARLTPDRPDYDPAAEVEASGLFTDITVRVFPFSVSYTADQFLMLLDTYASHAHLDAAQRETLHEGLNAVIREELGGVVAKPYEAFLVLSRRVENA